MCLKTHFCCLKWKHGHFSPEFHSLHFVKDLSLLFYVPSTELQTFQHYIYFWSHRVYFVVHTCLLSSLILNTITSSPGDQQRSDWISQHFLQKFQFSEGCCFLLCLKFHKPNILSQLSHFNCLEVRTLLLKQEQSAMLLVITF